MTFWPSAQTFGDGSVKPVFWFHRFVRLADQLLSYRLCCESRQRLPNWSDLTPARARCKQRPSITTRDTQPSIRVTNHEVYELSRGEGSVALQELSEALCVSLGIMDWFLRFIVELKDFAQEI